MVKIFIFLSLFFINIKCFDNLSLFKDKKILITGGTGYLGRSLTNELLKYDPEIIKILSRDEVKHFNFSKVINTNKIKQIIGDIRDFPTLLKETKDVDIVIHAAALKRIDLIEDNVFESIKTNVIGSINVFESCRRNSVKKVVFVSTDKASMPINTYGACKFVSEKIFTNYDIKNTETIFSSVRYGNVLDSTGSIIPIIYEKIQAKQDIPLTDENMTRFIIHKNEAIDLIFDAIRYSTGGEIFVKKLPSVKITDLIEVLRENFKANNKVVNIGIRPGEKIHELLISESEALRTYEYNNNYVIVPCTKNWHEEIQKKGAPLYLTKGKLVKDLGEFSSDKFIISKEEIINLFKTLNLF